MSTVTDIRKFNLYIDGEIAPATDGDYFECINPSTGDVFARVADATQDDMLKGINAARRAFDSHTWSNLHVAQRGIYLKKIAKAIRDQAKELAELETFDVGKTIKQSTFIDVPTAADTFEHFSNISDELSGRVNPVAAPVKSTTEYEPMGVVGCVIPYNYPLIMAAWKIAPALMAGNCVVFKPSPLASASIMRLAEIIKQCDLPKGVLNIIPSRDNAVSAELIKSKDVDMISFTGGSTTGEKIMSLASETTKKVSLELGGKSPNIVFADCDFEAALGGTMSAIFMNQGQMCTAGARLLLDEAIYDKFLTALIEKTKGLQIGEAISYDTSFGPVISKEQRDKALKFIEQAVADGAKIVCGGKIPDVEASLQDGFYIEPTILTDVTNDMAIAKEEIFGPVLAVIKVSSKEEAIKIANDSEYGLAATIWTKDLDKANEVSKKLQCGIVWVNTYGGFYNEASFGGYKRSGFGRELGLEGILEYTQSKHVCVDTTPGGKSLASSWF